MNMRNLLSIFCKIKEQTLLQQHLLVIDVEDILPKHKKSEEKLNEVRTCILSFSSYESHYTRGSNDKNDLPSHFNLQIRYELYAEIKTKYMLRKNYEREFHALSLSFKKPSVDTCHKCVMLHMKLKVTNETGNAKERESVSLELRLHPESK